MPDGGACYDPCEPWNETVDNPNNSCTAVRSQEPQEAYDGDPLFFPIDDHPDALTPPEQYLPAEIPEQYGYNGWPPETDYFPDAPDHNFHFTTEVHYWFQYNSGETVQLDFTGDDDVWVFVNGNLALDLGGWHVPLDGTVTVNAQSAASYGLSDGNVYEIAIFHAERQTTGSSFRLTLSGFNLSPSFCEGDCGDGEVGPGEECDDGVNDGGYEECAPGCVLGPSCGDAIIQDTYGEVCDLGANDGVNDGGYGECSAGCVLGPYCGDGNISVGFEECDDGENQDGDGCSAACKLEVAVPQ